MGLIFCLGVKSISWFLQGGFTYFQVYIQISQRCSKSVFTQSCAMGMHSFELTSQCSFLCGWFLFVVLSVVLKFRMKAASAGT